MPWREPLWKLAIAVGGGLSSMLILMLEKFYGSFSKHIYIWDMACRHKARMWFIHIPVNLNNVSDVPTMFTGVMDFNIFVSSWAGVPKNRAVNRNMTGGRPLAPCSDHPQSPRGHTVDWPICISVHVTDGDGKASIVCSYYVQMKTLSTGNI